MTLVTLAAARRPRPAESRIRAAALIFAMAVNMVALLVGVLTSAPPPPGGPSPTVALALAPPPPPLAASAPHRRGALPGTTRRRARARSPRPRPAALPPVLIRPVAAVPLLQVPAPSLTAPKDLDLTSPAVGEGGGSGLGGSGAGVGSGAEWGPHAAAGAPDVEIRQPVWERRPTRAEVRAAYPHAAYLARLRGWGRLGCRVRIDRRVDQCMVLEEAPAGAGFGAAALKLSLAFRFRPSTVGGRPHEALVVIPYEFDVTKVDMTTPPRRQ